jgi:CHAT domain
MYDFRIDPAEPNLELCPRYLRTDPATKLPLAESPKSCREQGDCPLGKVETARTTVCPFGFWGFRHEIELRLRPTAGGVAPIDRTKIPATAKPAAAAAMYAFSESKAHLDALGQIVDAGTALSDRDAVLAALRAGDRSLYYFFCHADDDKDVRLTVATDQFLEPGSIAARYEAEDDGWALAAWDKARPLVFLNACQSIALEAQLISPFLDKFVALGASALVGTEVRVFTELAADFGAALLRRMIAEHETLGTALLRVRRRMLGQGNPMGLAYAAYGSAALHFHEVGCACEAPA